MTTHEREITEPVELCTPDGRHLNPLAKGWSRTPLHVCNLQGVWGRTKRWDYWAVLTDRLALAITYGHVDYLGTVAMWWVDLETGVSGGAEAIAPLARGLALPDRPGTEPLRFRSKALDVDLIDEPDADGTAGTTLRASWRDVDGSPASLEARVDLPPGHQSVNVVIPWSDTRFQFTSKHQARPARGTLVLGTGERTFGAEAGDPAWGVLDVGRGRWPYRTRWNWGGGAGLAADGRTTVGIQIGGRWTVGTGFTENGIIVDGVVDKVGAELRWSYDWDRPLQPWHVRHPDGSIDLTLTPVHDRHTKVEALVLGTEVHQVFGRWSGHVTAADGRRIEVGDIAGFAEESRSRW